MLCLRLSAPCLCPACPCLRLPAPACPLPAPACALPAPGPAGQPWDLPPHHTHVTLAHVPPCPCLPALSPLAPRFSARPAMGQPPPLSSSPAGGGGSPWSSTLHCALWLPMAPLGMGRCAGPPHPCQLRDSLACSRTGNSTAPPWHRCGTGPVPDGFACLHGWRLRSPWGSHAGKKTKHFLAFRWSFLCCFFIKLVPVASHCSGRCGAEPGSRPQPCRRAAGLSLSLPVGGRGRRGWRVGHPPLGTGLIPSQPGALPAPLLPAEVTLGHKTDLSSPSCPGCAAPTGIKPPPCRLPARRVGERGWVALTALAQPRARYTFTPR